MGALADLGTRLDTRWMLVVFLLVLDVWAVNLIVRSRESVREKALWSSVVILCPIVGCLLWYVHGPKPDLLEGS